MAGDYYLEFLSTWCMSKSPPLDISLLCSEIMDITLYHMHKAFNLSSDTVVLRQLHERRSKIATLVTSSCNMSFTN